MKFLIKLLLFLLTALLLGTLVTRPAVAEAPTQSNNDDYESGNLVIKNDAIQQPISVPQPSGTRPSVRKGAGESVGSSGGRNSTRAEKQISEESLRIYLMQRKSPLAEYSSHILASPYWSAIIGICTIEQYGCTRAPGNNYWGIMCGRGIVCRYATLEDGIKAIDSLLTKYEAKGKDTIEELNGYYVQPASQNWYNVVLKTKLHLESLTP